MALTLDQVCDLDCVASTSPLVVDLASTERYVYGLRAIAQRVLVGWIVEGALLELDGHTLDPDADLVILRAQYRRIAEEEDYVLGAGVTATLVDDVLTIAGALRFVDGRTYLLEVTSADAVSVNFGAA